MIAAIALTFPLLVSKRSRNRRPAATRLPLSRRTVMKLIKVTILVVLFATAVFAQTTWDPELQVKIRVVGAPRVSPDGKRVAYTVSEAAMTPDRSEYVTQIWLATT